MILKQYTLFAKICQNTSQICWEMNGFPSPLGGEGKGEGEMILSSLPPQSSPIKGEESLLENWTVQKWFKKPL